MYLFIRDNLITKSINDAIFQLNKKTSSIVNSCRENIMHVRHNITVTLM